MYHNAEHTVILKKQAMIEIQAQTSLLLPGLALELLMSKEVGNILA